MFDINNIYYTYSTINATIQLERGDNMLIDKIKEKDNNGLETLGNFIFDDYYGDILLDIYPKDNGLNINNEELLVTEFASEGFFSDYHSIAEDIKINGFMIAIKLNLPDVEQFFSGIKANDLISNEEIKFCVRDTMQNFFGRNSSFNSSNYLEVNKDYIKLVFYDKIDDFIVDLAKRIQENIRAMFEQKSIHITRMFGSYILLANVDGNLKAIEATPIPIKYCPLMTKLLKEVGGETAEALLQTLSTEDTMTQTKMMCNLINEVLIKGGFFDSNRPLNSCEANVLFGASETIASAFKNNLVDAAVIVSNNLGTIITTNDSNTQGAVKRMTGLFYTSPSKTIVENAREAGIIPIFPYTAAINQVAGVKKAIALGYKNIAVTLAANNNYLQEELREIELDNNVNIYKFGLCSTGIDDKTAIIMRDNADIVWSCASKQVKKFIEPNAIAQVGVKIPVHIMTKKGWMLVKNHLYNMSNNLSLNDIQLTSGDEKSIFLSDSGNVKVLKKKDMHICTDCPHPCI